MIKVEIDTTELRRYISTVAEPIITKSISGAINSALISARKQAMIDIADQTELKQKDIKARIGLFQAKPSDLSGYLRISDGGIPLVNFGARIRTVQTSRGKRTGATIQIPGGRQVVPGGFLVGTPGISGQVYGRVDNGRYPIQVLKSKPLFDLFPDGQLVGGITSAIAATFPKRFEDNMAFHAKRAGL